MPVYFTSWQIINHQVLYVAVLDVASPGLPLFQIRTESELEFIFMLEVLRMYRQDTASSINLATNISEFLIASVTNNG